MEKNNAPVKTKSSFTGSIGFVLAAAGSAVGLGNIWRFPSLAAKNGGGLFILIYIILAVTFGFALLTTDIAIGRKTGKNALQAYAEISKKWKFLGVLSFAVPAIILTYYSVVGGWITKYMVDYVAKSSSVMARDGYFTDFITSPVSPIVFMFIFLAATALVVYLGVEKGIEKFSKFVMPGLIVLTVIIAVFAVTRSHTTADGTVRTGFEGLKYYFIPNFEGITVSRFFEIVLDAMCQLFYSLSVSMGIMITYGSYVKKDVNLSKSVTQIELFDTGVAILAGLMVIPTVYVFQGLEGMGEGAGLMFVALPKIFNEMGVMGRVIGFVFFIMVEFAALTSSVSIMETVVANCMNKFNVSRKKMSLIIFAIFAIAGIVICLGYNVFYFEINLPNGAQNQQLLDLMDYISNYFLMPIISLLTCVLVGWILKPKWVIDEVEASGHKFGRKTLYTVIIKYFAPVMMAILFIKAIGLF